ncbi:MAG: hypothetical protein P8X74_01305 [Reinekea sp.]
MACALRRYGVTDSGFTQAMPSDQCSMPSRPARSRHIYSHWPSATDVAFHCPQAKEKLPLLMSLRLRYAEP